MADDTDVKVMSARGALRDWIRKKILDRWSEHPSFDLITVAVIGGVHLAVVNTFHHGDFLTWPATSDRTATYAAGAGVMSLIAGFAGTAIAQYGSSSGPIVTLLRQVQGPTIRRNWLSITSWLLISAVLCLAAMALNTKSSLHDSQWIFEFSVVIAVMKFARLVMLFSLILRITDKQDAEKNDGIRTPQLR